MGLHFWLLEDLGGKAASCEEASSIKLLQVFVGLSFFKSKSIVIKCHKKLLIALSVSSFFNILYALEGNTFIVVLVVLEISNYMI